MFYIPEPVTALYTGAQDYFNRAQRAWEAGCAAWNEVPDVPTRLPIESETRNQATKHTEWVDVPDYLTTRLWIQPEIIISHRDKAFNRAECASATPISASRLVLWTDASAKKDNAVGWAVAFWDGLNWVRITARGPTVTQKRSTLVDVAELQAIGLALDYAVQFVERNTETPLQILEVYTDSQSALRLLQDAIRHGLSPAPKSSSKLARKSIKSGMVARDVSLKIKKLEEAGVHTEFHWVPRSTTLGNILADRGAGLARMAFCDGYALNNALVEIMPSHTDENKYKGGRLPLAQTQEFIHQSCMAEHIASILGNREIKSVEDECMENTPEESQDPSPNLDLPYEAPVPDVCMTEMESIPVDPALWRLYGESL
ncbi:hypothetical protein NW768_006063 [Fusarium equiseti]|uniref:RNase H type-1 domain-containing protein n=1 Tax=Fusarium equiseti TaxID=61235 RepID=A0ABQ8RDL9_FUSEQ|nr:hypothetical protein NW768_006063 [Fusarium equiseti]